MNVAVTTFGTRVSPRFDCAPVTVVLEIAEGKVVCRDAWPTRAWTSDERTRMLIARGVDCVICGGIDRDSAQRLIDAGISVCGDVCGESDEVITAILQGKLQLHIAEKASERRNSLA